MDEGRSAACHRGPCGEEADTRSRQRPAGEGLQRAHQKHVSKCAPILFGFACVFVVDFASCRMQGSAQHWSGSPLPGLAEAVDPDSLNCSTLEDSSSCELRNGCSWCEGVGGVFNDSESLWVDNVTSCRAWQHCQGPPYLCELRENLKDCENEKTTGLTDPAKKPRHAKCVWCRTENRCVVTKPGRQIKSPDWSDRGRESDKGQCRDCNGDFDIGEELDLCHKCGGSCVAPDAKPENPACDCLGCDLVPLSGKVMDRCGVCGGDNSTCSLYPVTLEEKVGVMLALSGNIVISVSLNIQKYTHNLNQVNSGGEVAYTDIPLWWTGMALMVVGEAGNFLAYAYAPATLVAPLGAVTVVSNCVIAHYVLKETIRKRNIAGVILAMIGAVFIVVYAPDSQKQLTMDLLVQYMMEPSFIIFIVCIVLAVLGLFLLDDQYKKNYVIFYILICSLCGSLTVMCVKGVSTALVLTMTGQGHPFNSVLPWLMLLTLLGTTIIQIRILNLAMMHFGASEVVPVYYVLFTFCSVVGGMVLYKEYHNFSPFFVVGIVITFTGVFLITFADKDEDRSYRTESCRGVPEELAAAEREGLLQSEDPAGHRFEMPHRAEGRSSTSRDAGPRFLSSEL